MSAATKPTRREDTIWHDGWKAGRDAALDDVRTLKKIIRAIELSVDGLNTKAHRQKPETQKTLDYIKSRCRDALS